MALYYWVGGYTGYKGMHSGYSTGNSVWTNWQTGATSSAGDFLFGPYSWGVTANWRIQIESPSSTVFYDAPTELPVGGRDSVIFKKIVGVDLGCPNCTASDPQKTINQYLISCLYGGMSGDGFTAASSTGWAGNNGLSAYQSIDITVDPSWGAFGPSGGFDIGNIGKISGITSIPLRVYPGTTRLLESPLELSRGATVVLRSMHSKSAVTDILTNTPFTSLVPSLYTIGGPYAEGSTTGRMLRVRVEGGWANIVHQAGSLVLGQMFSAPSPQYLNDGFGVTWHNQPTNVLIRSDIRKFVAEESSNVHYYMIEPKSVLEGIEIRGRSMWPLSATHGPNVSLIRVAGWKNMSSPQEGLSGTILPGAMPTNGIVLGKISNNSADVQSRQPFYIQELHVDNQLSLAGGTFPAHVWLANTEISEMKGIAGSIVPLTNYPTSFNNNVRIRNGYAMNGFTIYTHDDYQSNSDDGIVSMVIGITNTSGYSGSHSALPSIGLTTISGNVYGIRYDRLFSSPPSTILDFGGQHLNIRFPPNMPIGNKPAIKTSGTSLTRPSSDPS